MLVFFFLSFPSMYVCVRVCVFKWWKIFSRYTVLAFLSTYLCQVYKKQLQTGLTERLTLLSSFQKVLWFSLCQQDTELPLKPFLHCPPKGTGLRLAGCRNVHLLLCYVSKSVFICKVLQRWVVIIFNPSKSSHTKQKVSQDASHRYLDISGNQSDLSTDGGAPLGTCMPTCFPSPGSGFMSLGRLVPPPAPQGLSHPCRQEAPALREGPLVHHGLLHALSGPVAVRSCTLALHMPPLVFSLPGEGLHLPPSLLQAHWRQ